MMQEAHENDAMERQNRLEARFAHLERQYEELNEVVVEQAALIRKLQATLQRVAQTLETTELDRIRSTNAKPPHSAV